MNQRKMKFFQFVTVVNEMTDKCLTASWCCKDHRKDVTSLIVDMNEEVIKCVSKHKDNFDELPKEFEEMVDVFLPILGAMDKTISKMEHGQIDLDATMPHGGVV